MGNEELTSDNGEYSSYRPMHDYRRVDVDAWAEQWFAGVSASGLDNKQRHNLEPTLYGPLCLYPDERESDAGDLGFSMEMLCLIGQKNPYNAQSISAVERFQHLEWEQRHELACMTARHIVRITLDDAETYAALRAEQDKAGRDVLTGAYNRRGLIRRLRSQYYITNLPIRQDITGQTLPPVRLTYFYGDVNGLKWINDTLGHHIGDAVIVEVAGRINEDYRESDAPIVYRQGGDEFGVILGNVADREVEAIVDRIMTRQLEKSRSEETQIAMEHITNKIEAIERSGGRLRVEAKRDRDNEEVLAMGLRIRHDLYINGEYIAPLYDIFTSAVGAESALVNNLDDLEQLRQAAEAAMFDAKHLFPRRARAME